MTPLPPPYLERVKLISGLLMALQRLLPKLTDETQIRKIRYEIKYHRTMLDESKEMLKDVTATRN